MFGGISAYVEQMRGEFLEHTLLASDSFQGGKIDPHLGNLDPHE